MRPVLTVEGKEIEVIGVHLHNGKPYKVEVAENNPMESKTYYDINWHTTYVENPLRIDLSKHLINKDELAKLKEVYSAIDKMVEDKSKELVDVSIEHTEACLKFPFGSESLKRKYELIQREQVTLIDVQEIVHEFMVEDVDLSGGVEIEHV